MVSGERPSYPERLFVPPSLSSTNKLMDTLQFEVRRGKKKAMIAIARMMLTSIYHMLSNNEDFHPDGYEATVHPQKPQRVALTLDNTLHQRQTHKRNILWVQFGCPPCFYR